MERPVSWARILILVGGIAMVIGAIEPMEGSLLILPGSGLFALGAFLAQWRKPDILYRVIAFVLIAIGVGVLWGSSAVGGFGGTSGRSIWWGVLVLPYLLGWSMGIWGPRSPRWLVWLGMAISVWYLVLFAMMTRAPARPGGMAPGLVLAATGLLTLGGCIYRLRKPAISGA